MRLLRGKCNCLQEAYVSGNAPQWGPNPQGRAEAIGSNCATQDAVCALISWSKCAHIPPHSKVCQACRAEAPLHWVSEAEM